MNDVIIVPGVLLRPVLNQSPYFFLKIVSTFGMCNSVTCKSISPDKHVL